MKMFSRFSNCLSLSKKKDSNEKQKGKNKEQPIVIGGHDFSHHEEKRRGSTYECIGCQQPGFGPYYFRTSDGCDFHYHKRCGDILRLESPPIRNHHPYPVGRYIFKERPPSEVRYCVVCGDQVRGLRYKVWRYYHYRNIHPLCAMLPPQIQGPCKPIMLKLEERIRGECPLCKGKAKGWAYNSTRGNYSYHVGCMKNKIIQSWQQNEEASENGGNKRGITIRVEIRSPQIQELAEAAIRLIIQALIGFPNIADVFIVLCRLVADCRRSH